MNYTDKEKIYELLITEGLINTSAAQIIGYSVGIYQSMYKRGIVTEETRNELQAFITALITSLLPREIAEKNLDIFTTCLFETISYAFEQVEEENETLISTEELH